MGRELCTYGICQVQLKAIIDLEQENIVCTGWAFGHGESETGLAFDCHVASLLIGFVKKIVLLTLLTFFEHERGRRWCQFASDHTALCSFHFCILSHCSGNVHHLACRIIPVSSSTMLKFNWLQASQLYWEKLYSVSLEHTKFFTLGNTILCMTYGSN